MFLKRDVVEAILYTGTFVNMEVAVYRDPEPRRSLKALRQRVEEDCVDGTGFSKSKLWSRYAGTCRGTQAWNDCCAGLAVSSVREKATEKDEPILLVEKLIFVSDSPERSIKTHHWPW